MWDLGSGFVAFRVSFLRLQVDGKGVDDTVPGVRNTIDVY
jgi:hypothetical protein